MARSKKKLRAELKAAVQVLTKPQRIALLLMLLKLLLPEAFTGKGGKSVAISESVLLGRHAASGRRARGKGSGRGTARSRRKGRPPKGKVPPQLRPFLFKKGHR